MPIGCCGNRPVSLAGLLADADFYPAQSPQGRTARAKLAYGIVAGRAAQMGNMPAYRRAMAGLNGLGDAASDAAAGAAATQQITQLMQSTTGGSARVSAVAGQVRTWVNLITGLANLGTAIGSAAGGDANAIRVANMVIGWVRSIGNGTIPPIPTLNANDLAGLVNYCNNIRPVIDGGLQAGFGIATAAIQSTNHGSGDANAMNALNTLQTWLIGGPSGGGGLLNALCTIPQVQAAAAAIAADQAAAQAAVNAAINNIQNPPAQPAIPQSTRCWDGVTTTTWNPATGTWSPCPPRPPAAGLETGSGGCPAGRYNFHPPAGVVNPLTGAVLPGTAGRQVCESCLAPAIFIPGVQNSSGLWATPPGCMDSRTGRVVSTPVGPCPAGTTRGSDGICVGTPRTAGGSSSGSIALPALAVAALAWKFLL